MSSRRGGKNKAVEHLEEQEDERRYDGGGNRRKRGRSELLEEEEEEDESYRRRRVSSFIDDIAAVDSDEDVEESDAEDDDFIDAGDEIDDIVDTRSQRRPFLQREDEQEDAEDIVKRIEERYGTGFDDEEDDEEVTVVEQQALLPSVRDPKLWVVKCEIGHEKEVVVSLMQKLVAKGSELQIKSVIALDHLENFIYVEADKEAHVRQAVKGMRYIYPNYNIFQVPLKEMADVLRVQNKATSISMGTWVRIKLGLYKGDLAKVVKVDSLRRRATVQLIPRIDLHALANKMDGNEGLKRKAFIPPARHMNSDEARELRIRVECKRIDGDYFEKIDGMIFKDGFLYKTVSLKSLITPNVHPSFDELEKFRQPAETGNFDNSSFSTLCAIRKKGHFMKGDRVMVVKGDLRNLKGVVEKIVEDIVYIKHDMPNAKDLPSTLMISDKELCKYFECGNHVKVVSGSMEGATGMVVSLEGHVVNILSDETKEKLQVFADNVVESSEVKSSTILSRTAHLKAQPSVPKSPMRSARGAPVNFVQRHGGGRGHDSFVGSRVKINRAQYKGCRGRVKGTKGSRVFVELESQMKIVEVDRSSISPYVDVPLPSGETSRYGIGSETPMHLSRTPQHPSMTPIRDSIATPVHAGMRTPMRDRAWDPYTPSPPRIVTSS